jgi:hypothetical protein
MVGKGNLKEAGDDVTDGRGGPESRRTNHVGLEEMALGFFRDRVFRLLWNGDE